MIALDLGETLWYLSKYGCTDRDLESGDCQHYETCAASTFSIKGKVVVRSNGVVLATASQLGQA